MAAVTVVALFMSLRKRVRLKVAPSQILATVGPVPEDINAIITVTNLSSFSVEIRTVGFLLKNGDKAIMPHALNTFPKKLGPREQASFVGDTSEVPNIVKCAFATTSCGKTVTGKSGHQIN